MLSQDVRGPIAERMQNAYRFADKEEAAPARGWSRRGPPGTAQPSARVRFQMTRFLAIALPAFVFSVF